MYATKCCLALMLFVGCVWCDASLRSAQDVNSGDLATAETSAKLLNLGGLFGQSGSGYPNYGYNYPNYGYNGYHGYNNNNRPYYSNSGYYPSNGYYGGSSSYYPSTGGGYYPSTGNGYYPTTNILGSSGYGGGYGGGYGSGYGGYGGYGGNGGLRQYSGYWQPDYSGQRNRGYGYYQQTDRFGLPKSQDRDYYRERNSGGYRGYD